MKTIITMFVSAVIAYTVLKLFFEGVGPEKDKPTEWEKDEAWRREYRERQD